MIAPASIHTPETLTWEGGDTPYGTIPPSQWLSSMCRPRRGHLNVLEVVNARLAKHAELHIPGLVKCSTAFAAPHPTAIVDERCGPVALFFLVVGVVLTTDRAFLLHVGNRESL